MENKRSYKPLLGITYLLTTFVYVSFGVCGYLAFGEETQQIITLNMGASGFTAAVKLSLCVGLYFTFPLMTVPVTEVLEQMLCKNGMKNVALSRGLLSCVLVACCSFIAIYVSNFGIWMGLIGASSCALLAFVLPPLIHTKLLWGSLGTPQKVGNITLIVFGVTMAVWGTIDSLHKITAK